MKKLFDGIRSRQRFGFAKSLLAKIKAAGIEQKSVTWDGFRVSARVGDESELDAVQVQAPDGLIITATIRDDAVLAGARVLWGAADAIGSPVATSELRRCTDIVTDADGGTTCAAYAPVHASHGPEVRPLHYMQSSYDRYSRVTVVPAVGEAVVPAYRSSHYSLWAPAGSEYVYHVLAHIPPALYLGAYSTSPDGVRPNEPSSHDGDATLVGYGHAGERKGESLVFPQPGSAQYLAACATSSENYRNAWSWVGFFDVVMRFDVGIDTETHFQAALSDGDLINAVFGGSGVTVSAIESIQSAFLPAPLDESGSVRVTAWLTMHADSYVRTATIQFVNGVAVSSTALSDAAMYGQIAIPQAQFTCGWPYMNAYNRVTFFDPALQVHVTWGKIGLSTPVYGSYRFDEFISATGSYSSDTPNIYDQFEAGGLTRYTFPAEALDDYVRIEYALGHEEMFLLLRKVAEGQLAEGDLPDEPLGRDSTVYKIFRGSPWTGWQGISLPPGTVLQVTCLEIAGPASADPARIRLLAVSKDASGNVVAWQYMDGQDVESPEWVDIGTANLPVGTDVTDAFWGVHLFGDQAAATRLSPDACAPMSTCWEQVYNPRQL